MTKLTITLLLGWLLLLSYNLNAQNREGLFNLKEGDWFEMQVKENGGTDNHLRYLLLKQLHNGNQQYRITLIRVKRMYNGNNGDNGKIAYFGYDSYYPPFINNKKTTDKRNQYTLEISPTGDILSFKPDIDNSISEITLFQISPKKRYNYSSTTTVELNDSSFITSYSKTLFLPLTKINFKSSSQISIKNNSVSQSEDILHAKVVTDNSTEITIPFDKRTGVPLLISMEGNQYILSGASFPISGNTVIKGKILNATINQISIENRSNYKINADSTFYCQVLLTHPSLLKISLGSKSIRTFMEPGDTLDITVNGNDPIQTIQYAGTTASNTNLTQDVFNLFPRFSWEQRAFDSDLNTYFTYRNQQSKAMEEILRKYEGKATKTCIDFIRTEFTYYLAQSKFEFCENHIYGRFVNTPLSLISNYPTDFFLETDTMPVMLNHFEEGTYFNQFLFKSIYSKLIRVSMSVGNKDINDFNGLFSIAKASLDGYSLYSQAYTLISNELKKDGYTGLQRIEPYYQDFINNCNDPAMVNPLKDIFEKMLQFAPGKKFPLKSLVLSDSSIFSLENYKGKPLCLYFCPNAGGLDRLIEGVRKFKNNDVEFIFAVVQNKYNKEALEKSLISKTPNIKIVYIDKEFKYLFPIDGIGRIFSLDKWFRIIDDNIENPITHGGSNEFEEAIKKTINATRYSKAEKTAMVKTAGWSFGSILFTALIGFWIYRIRIGRIRQQEAVRRRIKELEIKAIRSQMNPHFIFNALNSIQSLINDNQFKEANIYLSKFAVLLRGVLNNSEKSRISLSDELQAVELYCQLEQLRFEFKFEISIDPEVNCDLIEIPGMIIQPLAENAIVHGLSAKGDTGKLNIQVKRQNGNLCIGISDNGVGLSPKISDSLSQKGFGLKLVEERINILNLDGKEARLTVTNNRNNLGTIATLTLPID